jgi:putative transposase
VLRVSADVEGAVARGGAGAALPGGAADARAGIRGAKRRGKPWRTTKPDAGARRPADLVNRDFTAERPNRLWVADFTYLRCWEGFLFFAFVIDVFSRIVVGWQLASNMRDTLVLDALRMALSLREPGAATPRIRAA